MRLGHECDARAGKHLAKVAGSLSTRAGMGHAPAVPHPETGIHPFDVSWRERVVAVGAALLIVATFLLFLTRANPSGTIELFTVAPPVFMAAGKFLPLMSITGDLHLGPYELGTVVWLLDTVTALLFVYSFEAFYRLPRLRRFLDRLHHNMQLVLQVYPRIKRGSVVGVFLFVLFPISGTGALAGSIIGILLGMNRFVLLGAVSSGGFFGGYLMAFLASNFGAALQSFETVQKNPAVKYAVFAGLVLLVGLALYGLNRGFRRALDLAEKQQRDAPGA